MNFNDLIPVQNVNSRVSYDLRYSQKTGKFTISASAFNRLNLDENGFLLFRSPDHTPVLQIVPNETADIFSGRSGSRKSLTFSANTLAEMLDLQQDTEYRFDVHNTDNGTFVVLGDTRVEPEQSTPESITPDDLPLEAHDNGEETETTTEIFS